MYKEGESCYFFFDYRIKQNALWCWLKHQSAFCFTLLGRKDLEELRFLAHNLRKQQVGKATGSQAEQFII